MLEPKELSAACTPTYRIMNITNTKDYYCCVLVTLEYW